MRSGIRSLEEMPRRQVRVQALTISVKACGMSTSVPPSISLVAVDKLLLLTKRIVLQCRGEWWWRMGNLQRNLRMGELCDLWFCPLVQLLLDCSDHCLPRNALQREEGSLAVDEAESRPLRQVGERQQQR